jgi:hypothetical protein
VSDNVPIIFRITPGAVVSEIIDGEAVIMQMRTGHYFSTRGTGAVLWDLLQRGLDLDTAAQRLADATGVERDALSDAIHAFTAEASRHQLGEVTEVGATGSVDLPALPSTWSVPVLEAFTDMEDLLLLDPIHDVAEEAGWPMQKPASAVE